MARRILETQRKGCRVVAVVSAMAGVTDQLIKLAKSVSPHPTERELDILLATGEQAASALTAWSVTAVEERWTVVSCVQAASAFTPSSMRASPRARAWRRMSAMRSGPYGPWAVSPT